MIAADTSVIIPAILAWHELHDAARRAIDQPEVATVGHCLVEAYSVATRLPPPHRVEPIDAAAALDGLFTDVVTLDADEVARLPGQLAALGIAGGATYDALIARTARHGGATLITADTRAARTYLACGVPFELVV